MATGIEWTDETLNLYTGCTKLSPGCDNCYMYTTYPRLKAMGSKGYQDSPDVVRYHPERLHKAVRWTRPRMVFVNSMSDTFHPSARYEDLDDIFDTLIDASERRGHVFQILTKRPGRAAHWWSLYSASRNMDSLPAGIWLGTSVESQKYAPRIEVLARVTAAIRFVSAEPLLDQLSLETYLRDGSVQWVITGGESGVNARPMKLEWARQIRDECAKYGIPFFFKQLGGSPAQGGKRGGSFALLDGRRHTDMPDIRRTAVTQR